MKSLGTACHKALTAAIAEAREAAGMSQRDLSTKLKGSSNLVQRIENGERRVDCCELATIAKACNVDPVELYRRIVCR